MNRVLWVVLRFSLSAWIGAASLFVVTGVKEVRAPFEAAIKNQLAVLRFPAYYLFGFTLVCLGTIAAGLLMASPARRRSLKWVLGLCLVALATMTFDYQRIYLPLEAMMLQPEGLISPDFWSYHVWSKYINFASLLMVLVATILASQESSSQTESSHGVG